MDVGVWVRPARSEGVDGGDEVRDAVDAGEVRGQEAGRDAVGLAGEISQEGVLPEESSAQVLGYGVDVHAVREVREHVLDHVVGPFGSAARIA